MLRIENGRKGGLRDESLKGELMVRDRAIAETFPIKARWKEKDNFRKTRQRKCINTQGRGGREKGWG